MVLSPSKNLLRLLELEKWHMEEQLYNEESGESDQITITPMNPKPKRPFLRKGAGLERFRMNYQPPKQQQQPLKATKSYSNDLKFPEVKLKPPLPLASPSPSPSSTEDYNPITDSYIDRVIEEKEKQLKVIDEIVKKTDEIGDQTLDLLLFEALEAKVNQSSFCSTNSSVVHMLENTPTKLKRILGAEFTTLEGETTLRSEDNTEEVEEEEEEVEDEEEETVETEIEVDLKRKFEMGTQTARINCEKCEKKEQIYNKNLLQKTREYETELRKQRDEFNEEKAQLKYEINELKIKLNKEKTVFKKAEENRKITKKEREEINNLKQEIANLNEMMKLKETKNGTTQARLRNQLKQLEKEIQKLREENEKLTKENAKLLAERKLKQNVKTTDTKILQKINENLTKLNQKGKDDENLDFTTFRDLTLEQQYGNALKNLKQQKLNDSSTNNKTIEKIEQVLPDGSKLVKYSNGNVKTISKDGNLIQMNYFNGDLKETNLIKGTIKYFYNEQKIWTSTMNDGTELVEFPNGQKELRFPDGRCEVTYPDGLIQTTYSDGKQEVKYPNGSYITIVNGEKTINLPNGQKEIHTNSYKKREYPDGTVKILFNDGTQETRYSNGRIRIKDANGVLKFDNCTDIS